jgi:uncharacterized protein YkwD
MGTRKPVHKPFTFKKRRGFFYTKFGSLAMPILMVTLGMALSVNQVVQQPDTEAESQQALALVNEVRVQYGRAPLAYDSRVFHLAKARLEDMRKYGYQDHTNPDTGSCPDNMKAEFGLNPDEYVAENIVGSHRGDPPGPLLDARTAIDSWMNSRGHRYNLLYEGHTAGALVCMSDRCEFLGFNSNRMGEGCYYAADTLKYWESAPPQPGEVHE